MNSDNDRKREREDDETAPLAKVVKLAESDEEDGFSDDSFEFNINLASQYELSETPLQGKARVMEVLDESVIVVKLDEKSGEETCQYHALDRSPEWVVQKGNKGWICLVLAAGMEMQLVNSSLVIDMSLRVTHSSFVISSLVNSSMTSCSS